MKLGGVLILGCLLQVFTTQALSQDTASRDAINAQRAWDAVVREKGGRDKLHAVTNLLIELNPDSKKRVQKSTLFVLPYYYWSSGYDIFGETLGVTLIDGNKNWLRAVVENEITDDRPGEKINSYKEWFPEDVLPLLLETKWYKPELVKVFTHREGKRKLEIIQTIIGRYRMDFVYEAEEMLIRRVDIYQSNGSVWVSNHFSDYAEMNGIKMPRKWTVTNWTLDWKYTCSPFRISLNVDYDPAILTPPTRATTVNAWKRQLKN